MPIIFVPTPLGNLRDITLRALDTLRQADVIVAEDTRVTRRLLSAHAISPRELLTYNEYTSTDFVDALIARAADETIAAVSDAGMPGINDPGTILLRRAREAGVAVELLPGPVAFIGAIVLSGFDLPTMSFEGFVPRSDGQRRKAFQTVLARQGVSAWYESPHRMLDTLAALDDMAPDLPIFLLREYTKRFEQQLLGTPASVRSALAEPVRGELVLVMNARAFEPLVHATADLDALIDALLAEGCAPKVVAKRLASEGHGDRRELYRRASERGKPLPPRETAD